MTRLYGEKKAKVETRRIFEIADIDKNGEIDFNEFKSAFVKKEMLLQEDKLEQLFKYLDADNSGTIDVEEFSNEFVGKQID